MSDQKPRVSIGLPVYNGANYIAAAIESILGQTFTDFELIISDNASIDGTEGICRKFAAQDSRVRYSRLEENVGAAKNFNRTVELARGEYFKWAAHDDMLDPEHLAKSVAALDGNPSAILACSGVVAIDDRGEVKEPFSGELTNIASASVADRFGDLVWGKHLCYEVFGLIRSDALRKTPLIGAYITSDRNLLAELSLMGPFVLIPEPLLRIRHHGTRSVSKPRHERL